MKKTGDSPGALPFEAAKPEETLPLLQSGVPRSSRLQCWSPGRKHSYISRIVKVHETAGLISISVSKEYPGGNTFESDMSRDSPGEILFSLHLPTDVIFFKGELRRGDNSVFNARIKEPIFKVQRRESLRLPLSNSPTVLIVLPDGTGYSAEILNVSEGGLGVTFRTKADFDGISKVKEPVKLTFNVFGMSVTGDATIRHGSEVGSSLMRKSYRLGFSFTEIDPKIRTQLSQLVFEESAKYLGRF